MLDMLRTIGESPSGKWTVIYLRVLCLVLLYIWPLAAGGTECLKVS